MEKRTAEAGARLSHAYIVAAPSRTEREGQALRLAAAMLCGRGGDRACGACAHCRKVMAGIHPDVLFLRRETDDKGRKRREIPVGRVRELVSEAQVMPNEAAAKVFVVEDADTLNLPAQNAMLKLLEEPPGSVRLILCAANPAGLLATVRSRCVLLQSNAEDREADEAAGLALEYLALAASGDRAALLRWCAEKEGMEPARAEGFLRAARAALADVLRGEGRLSLSARRCLELDGLFCRCERYLKLNTGTRHVFGLLAVNGIGGK